MKITEQEHRNIIRRVCDAMERIQTGEDAIRILAEIYCDSMPDKEYWQGRVMAQETLRWIGQFNGSMESAEKDPEGYVRRSLAASLKGLPLQQQCTELRRVKRFLELLDAEEVVDEEALQRARYAAELEIDDSVYAQSLRNTLLSEVAARVVKGKHLRTLMGAQFDGSTRDWDLLNSCIGEDMQKAVTAMVIYTMAKNGELENVPDTVTLPLVTIGVCAEDEITRLKIDQKDGLVNESKAENTMQTIAAVVLWLGVASLAAGTVGLVMESEYLAMMLGLSWVLLYLGLLLYIWYEAEEEVVREEKWEFIPIFVDGYPEPVAEDPPVLAAPEKSAVEEKLIQPVAVEKAPETEAMIKATQKDEAEKA